MKKFFLTLTIMLITLTTQAMSYQQAREHALFLTDKMAYELDLTEEQYEAAYEVNLDYLMSVTTADDLYSDYWTRRNLDLSYILFDWQYRTFCGIDYFYRPLHWSDGIWRFRIFAHYPHRTYFYFGRPSCYYSYRGAHAWHMNGGRSWYKGHHFKHHDYGMRGGWDRGGYRGIKQGWHHNDGGSRGINHNMRPADNHNRHRGTGYRGNNEGNRRGEMQQHNNNREYNNASRNNGDRGNRNGSNNGVNSSREDKKHDATNSTNFRNNSDRGNRNGSYSDRGTRRGFNQNGSTRQSSTRTTVGGHTRSKNSTSYTPQRSFSGNRSQSTFSRGGSSSSRSHSTVSQGSSFRSSGSATRSGGGSRGNSGGGSRGGHFGGGHR